MSRELRLGCTGNDVAALQGLLNFHLSPPPEKFRNNQPRPQPIAVDGNFGPQTQGRVILFQQINDLDVDGIVGPQTTQALLDVRNVTLSATLNPNSPAGSSNVATAGPRILTPVSAPDPAPTPTPTPTPPSPSPSQTQRQVVVAVGQQANVAPFFFQPLVLNGQFNWIFRRDGSPDFVLSAGGSSR
jgi:peptidoglycan hydrolase-like protein with peptidoglycan-binding domain